MAAAAVRDQPYLGPVIDGGHIVLLLARQLRRECDTAGPTFALATVGDIQSNDSLDRQALLDAGLGPDDPQVWAAQRRVQLLLTWHGVRLEYRRIDPDDPLLHS